MKGVIMKKNKYIFYIILSLIASSILLFFGTFVSAGDKDCKDLGEWCKDSGGCEAKAWFTHTCKIVCKGEKPKATKIIRLEEEKTWNFMCNDYPVD